ncbi:MAG: insulinase family protein, partial [Thermoanaerobaculia bacterium]
MRPRRPAHTAGVLLDPERAGEELRIERLDNGLTVALAPSARAPVVATALWYRAGTRDEPDGHGGTAHFLEHMMFKGSPR